jgi:hypothetical protein
VMRLSPAVRLVIGIGSDLLVAAAIAVALTVPAPAFDELCMIMTAPLSDFGRHQSCPSSSQCGWPDKSASAPSR